MRRFLFTLLAALAMGLAPGGVAGQVYPNKVNWHPGFTAEYGLGHSEEYHKMAVAIDRDDGVLEAGFLYFNWQYNSNTIACGGSNGPYYDGSFTCISGIGAKCAPGLYGDFYLSMWAKTSNPDSVAPNGVHRHNCGEGDGTRW